VTPKSTARPLLFPALATSISAHAAIVVAQSQGWSAAVIALWVGVSLGLAVALLWSLVRRAARVPLQSVDPTLTRWVMLPLVALLGLVSGHLRGPPTPVPVGVFTARGTVLEVEVERGYVLDAVTLHQGTSEEELKHPLRIIAPAFDPPTTGTAIAVEVELAYARVPRNPSTTPELLRRPFAEALSEVRPEGEASWAVLTTMALRQRLTFDSPVATSLYRALILGDRKDLDSQTRFAYQDTGTAHLLAISGMNLALLGLGLFALIRWGLVRFPPTRTMGQGMRLTALAALLSLIAIAAYGKIIAPSDATDRALIAFGLVTLAVLLMRRPSGARTVMVCALIAVVLDPEAALRPGFQLSFAATTALVLVARPLQRMRVSLLEVHLGHLPPWARTVTVWLLVFLGANLATSIATLPLGLAWFGQLPLHGLWVNLLAIPFMSLVVFPAGVVFSILVSVCPPLGDVLAPVLVWLAEAFDTLIVGTGGLVGPSSTQAWPLGLALLSTVGLLMFLRNRLRLYGAALVLLSIGAVGIHKAHDGRLELHALDVGHGDALAMVLPRGPRVVVDVGGHLQPVANRNLAERVVLPALLALGFEHIDLLILTHGDLDHAGAAPALIRRLRVDELWIPPCSRHTPAIAESIALIEGQGGRVREIARGPPLTWGGAELEVLWPPPDIEHEDGCSYRDNDVSIVVRVAAFGRRILLTGDIERPAEEAMLADDHRRDLALLRAPDLYADVLKSPHHGSRSSSTDQLLTAVSPRFAIVSGLPGRGHMPPHQSVIQRYAERNLITCITGEVGAVKVAMLPSGQLEVDTTSGESCRQPSESRVLGTLTHPARASPQSP
jgi:competence protein ComEC